MRRQTRTPQQSAILDVFEHVIQPESLAKNQYIISQLDEKGNIKISNLVGAREFYKVAKEQRDLRLALLSHQELAKHVVKDAFKFPFQIDTRTLIFHHFPSDITENELKIFIKNVSGVSEKMVKTDNGAIYVTFGDPKVCMAFWRSLNYISISGHYLEAIISIQKVPDNFKTLVRSQSMQFKSKTPVPRPEKLPHLKISFGTKDTNFQKNE